MHAVDVHAHRLLHQTALAKTVRVHQGADEGTLHLAIKGRLSGLERGWSGDGSGHHHHPGRPRGRWCRRGDGRRRRRRRRRHHRRRHDGRATIAARGGGGVGVGGGSVDGIRHGGGGGIVVGDDVRRRRRHRSRHTGRWRDGWR